MHDNWPHLMKASDDLAAKGAHIEALDLLAGSAPQNWDAKGFGRQFRKIVATAENWDVTDHGRALINEKIYPEFEKRGYPATFEQDGLPARVSRYFAKRLLRVLTMLPENSLAKKVEHKLIVPTAREREIFVSYMFFLLVNSQYKDLLKLIYHNYLLVSFHPSYVFLARKCVSGLLDESSLISDRLFVFQALKKLCKEPRLSGKIPDIRHPWQLRDSRIDYDQQENPLLLRKIVWQAHQEFARDENGLLQDIKVPKSFDTLTQPEAFKKFCEWTQSDRPVVRRASGAAARRLRRKGRANDARKGIAALSNPRVLLLSDNWSFIRGVHRAFVTHGADVRCLSFQYIESSVRHFTNRNSEAPGFDAQLFVHGPMAPSRDRVLHLLEQCAPLAKDLLDWCDVVFVEWANATAVWCSRYLPDDKRLVVRCHSYEAFSHWPIFIDHNRVDKMVFIADHVRQIYELHLKEFGGLNADFEVIPNLRTFEEFLAVKGNDAQRSHTLGMLKYADANKDPIFALDILAGLLEHSKDWKIRFAGDPFPEDTNDPVEHEYAVSFRKRAEQLKDHVVFDGFQSDPASWFAKIGFIISASEREGSHESIVEGMAAGCVPVIRRWPLVKEFGAPACVFPDLKPFSSPAEASAHIASIQDNFDDESLASRAYVREKFDVERIGAQLAEFTLI